MHVFMVEETNGVYGLIYADAADKRFDEDAVIQKALDLGARGFIQKPFTPEKVISALSTLEG